MCAVPNCDVNGQMFLESAHIKPDNVAEDGTPHRTHILNGLCLCRHCHIAFDKGYFSLTDDYRIIISTKFTDIVNQNLKTVIISSADAQIKNRVDGRLLWLSLFNIIEQLNSKINDDNRFNIQNLLRRF